MPALEDLRIGYDNWQRTRSFFNQIQDLNFPNLRRLRLYAFELEDNALVKFLERHKNTLCRISFVDCNLFGSWHNVMRTLQHCPELKTLDLDHLAQFDRRVTFPTTADIPHCPLTDLGFVDWVYIMYPCHYSTYIYPWENNKGIKLLDIMNCLTVTSISAKSDQSDAFAWLQ